MQDYDVVGILHILYNSIKEKEEDLGAQDLQKREDKFLSGLNKSQLEEYQKIKNRYLGAQKKKDMQLIRFVLDFVKKMI